MRLPLVDWLTALVIVAGLGLVTFGLWLAWEPLGPIAAGLVLIALAFGWYRGAET